jgi:hypothetical protein
LSLLIFHNPSQPEGSDILAALTLQRTIRPGGNET